MVLKTSFTSFERDSKWECRLYMTSLSMGRKSQPTKQPINYIYKEKGLNVPILASSVQDTYICSRTDASATVA